jgi:PAS domain S-box-containing protein
MDHFSTRPATAGSAAPLRNQIVEDGNFYRTILDALPAAVYATDAEGYITYFNRAAIELAGRVPQIGRDRWCVTWRLLTPDGQPLPQDQCPMAMTLREKRPINGVEAVAERPDGRRVPFMPYPTPLFSHDGELIGGVNMLVDISDLKRAEAARERLAAIVDSSDDAIVSKNLDGTVVSWNQGARRIFGYGPAEMIGQSITKLIPADRQGEEPEILDRIRRGEVLDHYETVRRRKDGTLIDISLTVSPVRDAQGTIVGASKIARDISARRRAELALARRADEQTALLRLTDGLHRAETVDDIFASALDAIAQALRCDRASVLLSDEQGRMRFAAWRGLSDRYRAAVDGHSPWPADAISPEALCIDDVAASDLSPGLKTIVLQEGIHACSFIPLMAAGRLIGKFMAYYDRPHQFSAGEMALALAIARQLAFGIRKKRAEEDLRANEERLRLATRAGKVGVWEWEIESGRVVWTDSLYAIHGLDARSLPPTGDAIRTLIHPDDLDRVVAATRASVEKGAPYEIEFRVLRPDGRTAWLFSNAAVISEKGRPVRLVGASIDITERKAFDAERDLLVAELSHRVKNTLATVISIAHQSFKGPSIEESRRSFDGRIRALAQTHGRLAEGNWSGVSLHTILDDELAPYRDEDSRNVRLTGPRIMLSPKQAVILGMALHELATNAAKYGALSVKGGIVAVTWKIAASPCEMRIQWSESGGPPVGEPTRAGFGRLLLERALASDLQGEVALDFASTGLTCEIAVPLQATAAAVH